MDADSIRYRVYKTPTEYVAVIAESALMAVRVAGITNPHKIMRDLPVDGMTIASERLIKQDSKSETVPLSTQDAERGASPLNADFPEPSEEIKEPFVPMGLTEMQKKGVRGMRILPPEFVHQIIQEYTHQHEHESPGEQVPAPYVSTEPTQERELTQVEKLAQMADQFLPPSDGQRALSEAGDGAELSPEEVDKLLNE